MSMLRNAKIFLFLLMFPYAVFPLQLGDGTREPSLVYKKVADHTKYVYNGIFATYIVKEDDTLWGTGYDLFPGKFRLAETDSFVFLMENVRYCDGTYLIKTDDSLWEVKPELKKICDNVKKVSDGLILKNDNTLWVYGDDYYGKFGIGREKSKLTFPKYVRNNVKDIYANSIFSLVVTGKDYMLVSGSHYLPSPFPGSSTSFFKAAENVRAVAEGFYITKENDLIGFGFSPYGSLGIGDIRKDQWETLPTKVMENIEKVVSSQTSTLILTKEGKLYVCGGNTKHNYFGELGTGNLEPVMTPRYICDEVIDISVATTCSVILKKDGTVWTCGANDLVGLL